MRWFIFWVVIILIYAPCTVVWAEEAVKPSDLRIEKDEAQKAFIFVIDGQSVAFLDKTGLHVRGDIAYGGSLADEGARGFARDNRKAGNIQSSDKEAADE